jgi:YggT family protein
MEEAIVRALYAAFTIYMMAILLYWIAPWLQIELTDARWRWLARIVDPPVTWLRKRMPYMGPTDLGPLAALGIVFVARIITISIVISIVSPS